MCVCIAVCKYGQTSSIKRQYSISCIYMYVSSTLYSNCMSSTPGFVQRPLHCMVHSVNSAIRLHAACMCVRAYVYVISMVDFHNDNQLVCGDTVWYV